MPTAKKEPAKKAKRVKADPMDVLRRALAKAIAHELTAQKLTQTEAARIMLDAPSQVSLVVTGKLRGFSTERLLRMLNRLGRDADVRIRKSKEKTGRTRLVA